MARYRVTQAQYDFLVDFLVARDDILVGGVSLSQVWTEESREEGQGADNAGSVSYEGSQVWRTTLNNSDDFILFRKLIANEDISLWNAGGMRVDYLVREKDKMRVYRELTSKSLDHSVLMHDVQLRIDATKAKKQRWTEKSLRIGHRLTWNNYPTLDIMEEYYDFLVNNFPSIISIKGIGQTSENRTIKMIKISNNNPANKGIMIIAGQHAREWVSITSALYIANEIITRFDDQDDYIKNKDWYIIPVLNPDGYYYSQTRDRLWRKNRRKNINSDNCYGVDINRNFPKHWQLAGVTTHDSCNEDYAGPYPFSEKETLALGNLINKLRAEKPLSAFFDLHSYGQMMMYPWAGKSTPSAQTTFLQYHGENMKTTIYNETRKVYQLGSPGSLLYLASGVAIDWVHYKGVQLCFAIETRDLGNYGFLLPVQQIEDTGKELWIAVKNVAKNILPLTRRSQWWY